MHKTILIRTLKTAFAALASIIVANTLSLDFSAAAGIIAILNVFDTRKATTDGGLRRTLSAILALAIGGICFEIFGYKTWVFGLYLLIFVPISFMLNIELGLGPSSVIVTHLMSFGDVNKFIILNEMALVFIGTGFAMINNFYAPNKQKKLNNLVKSIDNQFRFLLNLFGESLVANIDVSLHENKIKKLDEDLDKAIEIAVIENENMIENSNVMLYDLHLRERELNYLKDIYNDLKSIPPEYDEGHYLSKILIDTASNLTEKDSIMDVKARLIYFKEHLEMMELPKNHRDFIIRATVFQVFRTIDRFIDINNYIVNKPM